MLAGLHIALSCQSRSLPEISMPTPQYILKQSSSSIGCSILMPCQGTSMCTCISHHDLLSFSHHSMSFVRTESSGTHTQLPQPPGCPPLLPPALSCHPCTCRSPPQARLLLSAHSSLHTCTATSSRPALDLHHPALHIDSIMTVRQMFLRAKAVTRCCLRLPRGAKSRLAV